MLTVILNPPVSIKMADASSTEDNVVSKKPIKEVLVYQDTGTFRHNTGDIYDGAFEIKKKDRSIKMNGTVLLED